MADNADHQTGASQANKNKTVNVTKEQLTQIINRKVQKVFRLKSVTKTVEIMSETQTGLKKPLSYYLCTMAEKIQSNLKYSLKSANVLEAFHCRYMMKKYTFLREIIEYLISYQVVFRGFFNKL